MTFEVTPIYAASLGLGAIALANIVSSQRARTNISILHGDNMALAAWIRRHANYVEFVPLALILMGLAEARGATAFWLHAMGLTLIATRLLHAIGLDPVNARHPLRITGGVGTQAAMLGAIIFLLRPYF